VSLGNAINYLSNGNDQSLKNRRDGPKPFREFTGYVLEQCAKALSQYSDPLLLPNYDGWLDMLKFSLKRGGLQWYEVANNNSMIHKYIRQQENKQTKQQGKS
jgi:hypothetical protein